ncbi:carboxymuconolactone decarboxylase family protein [Enterococcus sp. 669A]|uniref:Carboxymuconolactone decarboxylase family protein n=1 Tax=Candidatus Enterococcus moelleringii TaxID=2815325 RepID=A0ABS3LE75_9ENTE|nr:carboxymuconolactone decarboxylase family protein [Enterococcus sp. 669A]MBO1307051.1 carboxymuconolactone decarboxylase family protein [Enterococcus sp. 669A]
MTDYKAKFEESKQNSEVLGKNSPELMGKFMEVAQVALTPRNLDAKTKELVAVGIAVSVRCEDCIMAHVGNAIKTGATMEELTETIEVAILMGGGPSTAYGAKALAVAEYLFSQE